MISVKSTKEIFVDSLIDLLAETSYEKITVRQIAENCGLSSRSFYNHFKDKNHLLFYLLDRVSKEILVFSEKPYPDWQESIIKLLTHIKDNIAIFKAAEKYQGQNSLTDSLIIIGQDRTDRAICRFLDCEKLPDDIRFANEVFNKFCYQYMTQWIRHDANLPAKEFVRRVMLCIPQILVTFYC
jgi:AcrR family transcriptional regulator